MILEMIGRAKNRLKGAVLKRHFGMRTFSLKAAGLKRVEIDLGGTLRIVANRDFKPSSLRVQMNGKSVAPWEIFRCRTPDRQFARRTEATFDGVVYEYLLGQLSSKSNQMLPQIEIYVDDQKIFEREEPVPFRTPDYSKLLTEETVFKREDIYGFGAPNRLVDPEVMSLVDSLPGPVLDFGCGAGATVRALRNRGTEIYGIELAGTLAQRSAIPEVIPFLSWYDGKIPTPYGDDQFESAICSEVLEHIPDFEGALKEICRITRGTCVFTVPDMSAVPQLWQHQVVPWHLLESTHVNFFSPHSFHELLRKYFEEIELVKLGMNLINGSYFYTSVGAVCRGKKGGTRIRTGE